LVGRGEGKKKGGEKGRRKKEEGGGSGGKKEKRREFSVLHMNKLLHQSQSCERTSQILKEFGTVLRWCGVARGSIIKPSQPISCNMLNNFTTILRDLSRDDSV